MSGFLRHIQVCHHYQPLDYVPFVIAGQKLGLVEHEIVEILLDESDLFSLTQDGLVLSNQYADFETRTQALTAATGILMLHFGKKLRRENYPVFQDWGMEPLAALDRVAVPWFGTRGFGVHVNGFVKKDDGLYCWIAERAHDRLVDPGKLDHIIAGGAPLGISILDNLVKEAWEEAGVPEALARTAVACGRVNYRCEQPLGLRNDTLYIFDLELPQDFVPQNTDGEVEAFMLMPVREVMEIVRETDRFKFNCSLVLVDFLIRHGVLGPEESEYQDLVGALAGMRDSDSSTTIKIA